MMKSSLIRINLIFILLALFIPNLTSAETKTFIKEYTYRASEIDSKVSCRTIALEQVKRLLLEELGSYLESHTEVVDFKLTKHQIITLTAGTVQTQILEEKWDGENYWLKAKINADPDVVIKSIDALRKNQSKTRELEELTKRTEWLLRENEKLKNELTTSKSKTKIIGQYNQSIKELKAIYLFREATALYDSGKIKEAINALSQSIELSPKFAWAYYARGVINYVLHNNRQAINDYDKAINYGSDIDKANFYCARGGAYEAIENYQQALKDYNKSIKLDPKLDRGYLSRGYLNERMENYQQALKDFNRAIELNPGSIDGYLGRAYVYDITENYQQSITEYNNVIRMEPKNGEAYSGRGAVYSALEDYRHALEDYNKAIELNPGLYYSYSLRGNVHYFLKNYRQAIEDYNTAIELNPKYAPTYWWRANAYTKIDHIAQATNDYKTAARLGHKESQDYLRSKGISW